MTHNVTRRKYLIERNESDSSCECLQAVQISVDEDLGDTYICLSFRSVVITDDEVVAVSKTAITPNVQEI